MAIITFQKLKEIAAKAGLKLEKGYLLETTDDASDKSVPAFCRTQEQVVATIFEVGVKKLRREKKMWAENTSKIVCKILSEQAGNLTAEGKDKVVNEIIEQCLMLELTYILSEVVKKNEA